MSRVGTSAVELVDPVLSGLLVPDEPKPNTAAHLLGLVCCFWWKRSAGIVYTAEFTRVGSHYGQESTKKKLTGSLVKTRETPSRKCSQTGFKKNPKLSIVSLST